MADRVISYDFRGNFTNLTAGLAASGAQVKKFGTDLNRLDRDGERMRRGLETTGRAAGIVAIGAVAGLAAIVTVSANFEQAMSRVQAATGESAEAMTSLRDAALEAGAQTAFSASEAAEGITALSKAGVATQDILSGGLSGALDLAAAGELDVAQAAEIAATTMTQFGLAGTDVAHIADVLSASAGKAQGEVTDMAGALQYVGPVAAQMGISLEETAGSIAYLATQGIVGQQAGTSLRGMLTALTSPSKIASDTMKDLGINMYDAKGQFVGLDGIAGQLQATMGGLTIAERDQAFGRIFGNEQITAARILYAGGAEAIEEWTGKVNDSGFATDQAATKLDNLKGDLEALGGSLETALIGLGDGSGGPLRDLVQGLTDVVNAFSEMPGPAQTALTGTLALTAGLGALVFVGTKVVTGMAAARTALVAMGLSATASARLVSTAGKVMGAVAGLGVAALGHETAKTNKALGTFMTTAGLAAAGFSVGGPWGAGIGAAIGLVIGLGTSSDQTASYVDEFTAALNKQTGALTLNNRELAVKALTDGSALDLAAKYGVNLDLVTDAALGNVDAIAQVNAEMDTYLATLNTDGMTGAEIWNEHQGVDDLRASISDVNGVVDESSEKFKQNAAAMGDASDATGGLTSATADNGETAEDTRKAVNGLAEAIRDQAKAASDAFDATTDWGAAVIAAREQVKTGEKGIDEFTEAGQNNRAVLAQLRDSWNAQPKSVKNSEAAYRDARKTFLEFADALGVGDKRAIDLANSMLDIPRERVVRMKVEDAAAKQAIQNIRNALKLIPDENVYVRVQRLGLDGAGTSRTDASPAGADGMTVPGKRQPYGDKLMVWVAPGEEIITNRRGEADAFRRDRAAGRIPRYADGGTASQGIGTAAHRGWDFDPNSDTLNPTNILLQIMMMTGEVKRLQHLLDLDGKNELSKQRKKVVELELKVAEKRLKLVEKEVEQQKAIRSVGRGLSFGSIVPGPELGVEGQVNQQISAFRRDIVKAGGEWTKAMRRWSKGVLAAAAAYDGTQRALDREIAKRDALSDLLQDQQRELDQLVSTMESYASSVSGNFLNNPFRSATPGSPASSNPELAALEAQLTEIRASAIGDSVEAAASASRLIAQIQTLRAAAQDTAGEQLTGVAGLRATLLEDTANANALAAALATLVSKGLDATGTMGGLYRSLAASGDVSTATELAALSSSEIDELERLFAAREDAAAAVAAQATQAVYGADQARLQEVVNATTAALVKQDATIARLNTRLEQLGGQVRAGAREGVEALEPQFRQLRTAIADNPRQTAELVRKQRT